MRKLYWNARKALATLLLGWVQRLWPDNDKLTHNAIGAVAAAMMIDLAKP